MGSLSKRMEAFTKERVDLLKSLAIKRTGVPDASQLLDKDAAELDSSYPSAPQLACDFRLYVYGDPGEPLTATIDTDKFILDSMSAGPATLQWKYENAPFGFPTPTVSVPDGSITFLMPSSAQQDPAAFVEPVLMLYDQQFSERGLLNPDMLGVCAELALVFQLTRKNWDVEEAEVKIMTFHGMRFGTPKFENLNPSSLEALKVVLPFAARSSRLADFTDTGFEWKNIASLESVYDNSQFAR